MRGLSLGGLPAGFHSDVIKVTVKANFPGSL